MVLVDQELSAKFDSELRMEKEMRDSDELPDSIRDYLENGPFEVRLVVLSPLIGVNIS